MEQEPAAITNDQSVTAEDYTDKREELTEYIRSLLIECGWRDQVASSCRNLIQKYGVEHVKLSQIINEVRSEARQKVPENVRLQVISRIRQLQQDDMQLQEPEKVEVVVKSEPNQNT